MSTKIISITFQPEKKLKVGKDEYLNMELLETECRRKGVSFLRAKCGGVIKFDGVSFLVYSSGKIGHCFANSEKKMQEFDDVTISYFWKNFAINCVKKREEF